MGAAPLFKAGVALLGLLQRLTAAAHQLLTQETAHHGQHIPREEDELDQKPLGLREIVAADFPHDLIPAAADTARFLFHQLQQHGRSGLLRLLRLSSMLRFRGAPAHGGAGTGFPLLRLKPLAALRGMGLVLFQFLCHRSPYGRIKKLQFVTVSYDTLFSSLRQPFRRPKTIPSLGFTHF